MRGAGGGGAHVSGGAGFGGGRAGMSGGFAAPRAAVSGGFNRGGTFAARTGTFAGRTGRGGHWVWRHHRRVFVPFAVGVGLAFGDSYYDDCVVCDGWRYVNSCYDPYY